MAQNGYLKAPAIYQNWIYFETDDDIFKVSRDGGIPIRLTSSRGVASKPLVSPDGKNLVFLVSEHGQEDAYLMPAEGGEKKRLTHFGDTKISGFKDSNHVLVHSAENSFEPAHILSYEVNIQTLETKKINIGPANALVYSNKGALLIGRNVGDPARWKRYRGGTVGRFWVSQNGRDNFKQILKSIPSHLSNPKIIGEKVYFISDHEGIGNIYSASLRGTGVKRITHHEEYYVRNFQTDSQRIVYQCGANIHLLDLKTLESYLVPIDYRSNNFQAQTRFESSYKNLQDFNLTHDSEELAFVIRGQLHVMPPWSKSPLHLTHPKAFRFKSPVYIRNEKKQNELVAIRFNEDSEEGITVFNRTTRTYRDLKCQMEIGKVYQIIPNPKHYEIVICNHKTEIWHINLKTGRGHKIDKIPYIEFQSMNWSPCGTWLAYCGADSKEKSGIKIWNRKTKKSQFLITPVLKDCSPVFDPKGDYLYFLGIREFNPVYSSTHFELSFPVATRPYAVCLRKEVLSPLDKHLDFDKEKEEDEEESEQEDSEGTSPKKKSKSKKVKKQATKVKKEKASVLQIDFENIDQRIIGLPISLSNYEGLMATKEKLIFLKSPFQPMDPNTSWHDHETHTSLMTYDLTTKKTKTLQDDVDFAICSGSLEHVLLESDGEVRLVEVDSKPTDGEDFNRKDGWIDLSRIKIKIDPRVEWAQMYREAWILQRENFWTADMSKIDWVKIYHRYHRLLPKVNTRREFSDLMWEMQGELGTSHCYEYGGDYHKKDQSNRTGKLGAEFQFVKKTRSFKISKVFYGDSWIKNQDSPLNSPGNQLEAGDEIYEVNGEGFENPLSLYSLLDGMGGKNITLKVKKKKEKDFVYPVVKPLRSTYELAYRSWVNKNRDYVHKKTKGKVGYVHIPNMMVKGFSEFFRQYLTEFRKDSVIIDVRYNGGGHVSQIILRYLKQKIIGFDTTRHFGVDPYPLYAVPSNLVCLTNEFAGSDGDIFCHSFKLMKLGKLIGKRTWGGVIGIWPRFDLVDGTRTSQPEFSFWFKDVGFNVENYGTDPNIEVDITPDHWIKGIDHQLDVSIREALKELKKSPPLKFKPHKKPNLKLPKLPNRPKIN